MKAKEMEEILNWLKTKEECVSEDQWGDRMYEEVVMPKILDDYYNWRKGKEHNENTNR